jgi:hypothetical protein
VATIQGMGPCLIPNEHNYPCGRQIGEGEAIGTITTGLGVQAQSYVGHKACADGFYVRKAAQEKEKNLAMVKKMNQGPDGSVDPRNATDLVIGSIPLAKDEKSTNAIPIASTVIGDMGAEGAPFLGNLPEGATPAQAVAYAKGGEIAHSPGIDQPTVKASAAMVTDFGSQVLNSHLSHPTPQRAKPELQTGAPQPTAAQFPGVNMPSPEQLVNMLPTVDAFDGLVIIAQPGPVSQVTPEDVEDFIDLLRVQIKRARRQVGKV